MADAKITALTANTLPVKSDIFPMVDDPGGTPATQKMTFTSLFQNSNWAVPAMEFAAPQTDFTLSAAAGVQSAFPAANNLLTVTASTTYFFDGQYLLNTGATTHTTALAFALAGGATVTSFEYTADAWVGTANALVMTSTATTHWFAHVSGVASKILTATNTAVWTIITFQGVARINAGGTIEPQINFSANPTGTNLMKVGSYIRFFPVGSNTVAAVGPWA